MTRYIYAAQRPWSLVAFNKRRAALPGQWTVLTKPEDIDQLGLLDGVRYMFFPHWSHILPKEIIANHECVCFHMTDVPFGRGGSPLQNLIARGHTETVISAIKMIETLDAGPVYLKRPLSLEGSALDIYTRAADVIMDMIVEILSNELLPQPQTGEEVTFARRKPAQSLLPDTDDLTQLYDHIRMLDAPGYPHAFLDFGDLRLQFDQARLDDGCLTARVRFVPKPEDPQ